MKGEGNMDVSDFLNEALCVRCFGGIILAIFVTMIARACFPSTCEHTHNNVKREVKSDLTTLDTWQEEQAMRGIPVTDAPPDEMLGPPWA
jgi:hypothetical protein